MNDRCLIYPRYLAALILSIPWGLQTLAQLATIPAPAFWSTDGPVHAITISSDTVYLGGNFGYVGPRSGPAAVVNLTTAEVATGFPRVAGTINTAVPDGHGGWYIGGTFTDVGGIPLANLAHVMPGGSVDTLWAPSPNGAVSVMLAVGNGLYVGGAFTRIANQGRANGVEHSTL